MSEAIPLNASRRYPWWLAPERLTLFFLLPCLWGLYAIAPAILRENTFHRYFAFDKSLFISGLLIAYAVGAWFGPKAFTRPIGTWNISDKWYDIFFALTLFGSALLFLPLLTHLSLVPDILRGDLGAVYQARELLETMPGVTTFTQAGIAVTALIGISLVQGRRPSRKYKSYGYIVCALAVLRMIVRSERLALIEVALPLLPYWAIQLRRTRTRRAMLILGPFLGIALLLLFFAVTEYYRSWVNHYASEGGSYIGFVVNRVGIYYVYAINTALGMLEKSPHLSSFPVYSFAWLSRASLIGTTGASNGYDVVAQFLNLYGVPQFNNVSGIVAYVWDYGWIGGAALLFVNGVLIGCGWRGFRDGQGFLRYIYPIMYVGLLDLLREPYLGQGRSLVPIVLLFVAYVGSSRGSFSKLSRRLWRQ